MEKVSALLALCEGNSLVNGEVPSQRSVTRSFGVFFDLCLNKRLGKQSWGWWFETPSRSLWRHCNVLLNLGYALALAQESDSESKRDMLSTSTVTRTPIQYPIRLLISRSREVSKPRDFIENCTISLKFDRHLGRSAAEVPVKFQSNAIISSTNLAASRLNEILRWDVLSDVETGPRIQTLTSQKPFRKVNKLFLYWLSIIL